MCYVSGVSWIWTWIAGLWIMKFPYTMGMGRLSVNQCVTTPCSMTSTAIPPVFWQTQGVCANADAHGPPGLQWDPRDADDETHGLCFFSRCALHEEGSMWLKQSQTIPPITINSRDKSIPKLQITIDRWCFHPSPNGWFIVLPKLQLFIADHT